MSTLDGREVFELDPFTDRYMVFVFSYCSDVKT